MRFFPLSLVMGVVLLCPSCKVEKKPFALPAVEVTTLKIESKTIPAVFEYVGFVESSHAVEIRARVEGYLNRIAYTEGGLVKEGDLLFIIDQQPFEASLDRAKGELKKQEALLWETQRTVDRLKPLFEQKAASQRDLDNAISQKLAAEAAVYSAQAQVRSAELNLGYTTIRSPISGLSSLSPYQEGALIIQGGGEALTKVSVLDPIWVKFNITSNEILKNQQQIKEKKLKFPENQPLEAEIVLADDSLFPHRGKVDYAAPTYDSKTGTMVTRATIPNPVGAYGDQLRPGQFVRIRVYGAVRPNAILVPQKAVQYGQDGLYVFVVDSSDKAIMRPIEAGEWFENDWIVMSGLTEGEQVIIEGVNKVFSGQQVTAKPLARD